MPTLNEAFVPHLGREFKFQDRSVMRPPFVGRAARMPRRAGFEPPVTPLPVDSTGGGRVALPILGNDRYGDCGAAMAAHRKQIIKFRQGGSPQYNVDAAALIKQYLKVSGGDNGLDEPGVISILRAGVAGVDDDQFVDALDIDLTDVPLRRLCIDNNYTAQMAWSVPNAFIASFAPGAIYANAMRPNPANGHYVTLQDVGGPETPIPVVAPPTGGGRTPFEVHQAMHAHGCHPNTFAASGQTLEGFTGLGTWGGTCWVSDDFIASVDPDGFVVFSLAQFDSNGLDSKGRHITAQARLWVAMGGNPIDPAILAKYPPPPDDQADDWSTWG